MATYQFECDDLNCKAIWKVTGEWGEIFEEVAKEGGSF